MMASDRLGPLVAANAARHVQAGRYLDDARRRVRARVELAAALDEVLASDASPELQVDAVRRVLAEHRATAGGMR